MKNFVLLLTIFLWCNNGYLSAQNEACREVINDGKALFDLKKYTEAKVKFEAAKRRQCNDAQSWIDKCNKILNPVTIGTGNSRSSEQGATTSNNTENGVLINGTRWATRNVAAFRKFAAKPEDAGMFYQWGRKQAWAVTGNVIGWDEDTPDGITWKKENDPSPVGWRVPTGEEIETLLDKKNVKREWTTVNGIEGYRFTDKTNKNSIFLPAAGYRDEEEGDLDYVGKGGCYWSSQKSGEADAFILNFSSEEIDSIPSPFGGDFGCSVRSVAK
jgi:uncharacterized protein (TIGR02145 family)